ncbi:MAG TPA: hypothetical protein VH540_19135 [Ktedonobacterales bacterium]|jgi:hypothetical protein
MPNQRHLRSHLDEGVKRGLPNRSFSEEDLWEFVNTATFDEGRIHRYVESRCANGAGLVADLQRSVEQAPEALLACLRHTIRLEQGEKRALIVYLRATFSLTTPAAALQVLFQAIGAIEAIPETPTYRDVPRFLLPGW